MVRYMTNFLSQYLSLFFLNTSALRELQSYLTLKHLREHTETRKMGMCCMTVKSGSSCKRRVGRQHPTLVGLRYWADTASVIMPFLFHITVSLQENK